MKLEEVWTRIVKEGKLTDATDGSIVKWSLENKVDENLQDFVSAVKEEQITRVDINPKTHFFKLEHSGFFIYLANSYAKTKMHDKAIQLFSEMEKKGSTESTMLNDYAAAILEKMLATNTFEQNELDYARKLIFRAFNFDKQTSKDCYKFPAYVNLCLLRAIEAQYYRQQNNYFAAFVMGWMSIEMTLHRIWRQYLELKGSTRIKDLDRWESEKIIEMLFIADVDAKLKTTKSDLDVFKMLKPDFDTLRGTRNHLLHGYIDNPTEGEADRCISTAIKIYPLFQLLDKESAKLAAK